MSNRVRRCRRNDRSRGARVKTLWKWTVVGPNAQARGNLPTVDPELGELHTVTQLVSDAAKVCEGLCRFLMYLTSIIGTPPLPILPCHGSICFACYPNASRPPLPTLVPSRLQYHQIQKERGLEVQPGEDEVRFRFSRLPRWNITAQGTKHP